MWNIKGILFLLIQKTTWEFSEKWNRSILKQYVPFVLSVRRALLMSIYQESLSHSLLKILSSVIEEYLSYKAKCWWLFLPLHKRKEYVEYSSSVHVAQRKKTRVQSLSAAAEAFGFHCEWSLVLKIMWALDNNTRTLPVPFFGGLSLCRCLIL